MNRTSNDLRKLFLRLKNQGKGIIEIANIVGVSRQTVNNWNKVIAEYGEERFLKEPSKSTRKPSIDLKLLKKYIEENPSAFNKEIAIVFNSSKNVIQKFRQRLGFNRKKFKTTYKESDPELKKSS